MTLKKGERKSSTLTKKGSLKLDLQAPSVMFVAKWGIGPPSVHPDPTRKTHIDLEDQPTWLLNVYSH